ncbi:putative glycerol kinase 5 isoform X2 [Ixodes scapularis]|uniref:putative glycerol kinase 5 isoform X2 n=1 Tax=Ixodes scapularis TaxID=6945 RepID=UPI001C3940F7|nr:putative glycerol kinase 5 isoform X2 [Ixodes scapularis]
MPKRRSLGAMGDRTKDGQGFVAAVDVGSTMLRCHIYDVKTAIRGSAAAKVVTHSPLPGVFEIDPEHLWKTFVDTIRSAIDAASLHASDIKALGISTQRGTFTTWDRSTGKVYHNFMSWKDTRAERLCHEWNKSLRMMALRLSARLLHWVTRRPRFLVASILRFEPGLAVMRLLWVLQNIPGLQEATQAGKVLMGTVDTFLLWRLTGGKVHATDPSNACITGIFDPFTMEWSQLIIDMLGIPTSLLPRVLNTRQIGDQQASSFGDCCFDEGDIKCTMGTGTFFNVNTGGVPYASTSGIYPVVGWKINDVVTYLAEGSSYDTGTAITWAEELGLLKEPMESSTLATSVPSSNGVFFVPAFSGLQAPVNDAYAASGFLGITPSTRRGHLVRAILESLAFQAKQVYEMMATEVYVAPTKMRFNGGVAKNDFLLQLLADMLERPLVRAKHHDTSALGAAFLAGLALGIWSSTEELKKLRQDGSESEPSAERLAAYRPVFEQWRRAVKRFLHWHLPKAAP